VAGLAALLAIATLTASVSASAAPVADRWAVVKSDGSLVRGKGVVSTDQLSTGLYEVAFASSVTRCVFSATIGNPGAGVPPTGTIVVAPRSGNTKAVLVITRNITGTGFVSAGFHLFVSCPDTRAPGAAQAPDPVAPALAASDRWAVVDQAGDLIHGRGAVSSTVLFGATVIVFDKNVTQCAYVAAESEWAPSEWGPGQVSVASRTRQPNGVYVRLTARDGDPHGGGVPFTLLVKCP
jgi:hypothetical protein